MLGWTPLSQREARLILFYKIINGLAQVPFECVLVEAYKGTRRKHSMKFRHIGHSTSQYGQSFFPKTISAWNGLAFAEAPSLAVFRLKFIVHPFRIIGSCGILNQNPFVNAGLLPQLRIVFVKYNDLDIKQNVYFTRYKNN